MSRRLSLRCVRRLSALARSFLYPGDVDRIARRDYTPSDDDVVRARLRTLGVQEHRIHFETGRPCPLMCPSVCSPGARRSRRRHGVVPV